MLIYLQNQMRFYWRAFFHTAQYANHVMPDDIPEIPPEELNMAVEETLGLPARTAEEGIKAMDTRIKYLNGEISRTQEMLNAADDGLREALLKELAQLRSDLDDAKTYLSNYNHQLNTRN